LSSINAHKISFCIKDKADDLAVFKRQRLDSLAELTTPALKRTRTKSEAVQDISSSAINEFVQMILEQEFKVFDESTSSNKQSDDPINKASKEISALSKKSENIGLESRRAILELEKSQLEQSLKVLKVLNFLAHNQDLISNQGLRLVMKSGVSGDADSNQ
jgi:hypothetical protein